MLHWLSHFFGLDNLSGPFYGFWSGIGSDLDAYIRDGIILLFALKMWNCHEHGCWRVGHMTTVEDNGHHFRRCKKHHDARHSD